MANNNSTGISFRENGEFTASERIVRRSCRISRTRNTTDLCFFVFFFFNSSYKTDDLI